MRRLKLILKFFFGFCFLVFIINVILGFWIAIPDIEDSIGNSYKYGIHGFGINKDKAAWWYEQAVARNDATAMMDLDFLLKGGPGGKSDDPRIPMLEKNAAAQNEARAETELAVAYIYATYEPQDSQKAEKLLQDAASQDWYIAEYILMDTYLNGKFTKVDKVKGIAWLKLLAAKGFSEEEHKLALLYGNGDGVAHDKEQAYIWQSIAAKQIHNHDYDNDVKTAAAQLTPAQLADADKSISSWRPVFDLPEQALRIAREQSVP